MTLKLVVAKFECDGCCTLMEFDLDPGDVVSDIVEDGTLFALAEEAVRGGLSRNLTGFSSLQGEHHLCDVCTRIVDRYVDNVLKKGEDYRPTREDVEKAIAASD